MSSSLTWILTNDGSLSIIAKGRHFTVHRDHENFDKIKAAIKVDNADAVIDAIDIQKKVQTFVQQAPTKEGFVVEAKNGCIYVNGQPIDNEISRRTRELMDMGLPFEHMARFLENLLQNPSFNSQKQLFRFLEHHKLPITSDGHFMAYKGIRANWTDCHSGKVDNRPGCKPEMPRYAVDDNPNSACSHGFHAGTIDHARSFGASGHLVLVKINPKDVVSVPASDTTKLRCCKYEVIAGYHNDLDHPVYEAPSLTDPMPILPHDQCCGLPPSGTQSMAAMTAMQNIGLTHSCPSDQLPPAIDLRDGAGTPRDDDDDDEDELEDEEDFDDDEYEDLDDDEDLALDNQDQEDDDDEVEAEEIPIAVPVGQDFRPTGDIPVAQPIYPRPPALG